MSNPKKIEDLDEVIELQNNDLVFASVLNSRGTYDSKNVTLENIANYVRNGMELGGSVTIVSNFGGYEIYDTSESGDGTCNSQEELDAYCTDNSRNLLFDLPMYSSSGAKYANFLVKHFEKTVSKDCLVVLNGWIDLLRTWESDGTMAGGGWSAGDIIDWPPGTDSRAWSLKINDKYVHAVNFKDSAVNKVRFYLKAGQTITIDIPSHSNWGGGHVSIIPLKSGGRFFIDTTKSDEYFERGKMSDLKEQDKVNGRYIYTYENKFDCPILFCSRFTDSFKNFDDRSSDTNDIYVTINGKYVHIESDGYDGVPNCPNTRVLLEPEDVF